MVSVVGAVLVVFFLACAVRFWRAILTGLGWVSIWLFCTAILKWSWSVVFG